MELSHFDSGAVRSADCATCRYDLITPVGMRRLAETCHEGAVKYSPFNWEKGMPINDLLNHVIAHCYKYLEGDRDEDHLAHAAWGCLAACHSEEQWPHLNTNLRREGCVPPAEPPISCDYSDIRPAAFAVNTSTDAADGEAETLRWKPGVSIPAVTRAGTFAIITQENAAYSFPFRGFCVNRRNEICEESWDRLGRRYATQESDYDLVGPWRG